jgi:PKD repeat protein
MVTEVWLYAPDGTPYNLTEESEFSIFDDSLPDLVEDLQDKDGFITDSELSYTAKNATGWWNVVKATLDPEARFDEAGWLATGVPGVWFLQLKKNSSVRWEGDLVDPTQITMDASDDAKSCTFTVTGSLSRFRRYNAALVRRAIPTPLTCTSDRVAHPKWIVLDRSVASSLLVKKDQLLLQKFGAHEKPSKVTVEIAATPSDDPSLASNTVRIKQRLKFNVTSSASVYCSTPYHRGETALDLVTLLFDHCNIPVSLRDLDPALADRVIPYALFEDKDCGDALEELASCIPAVIWRDPSGVHVKRLDSGIAAGTGKVLDSLAMEPVASLRWPNYHSAIAITGAKDRIARRGRLTYPSSTLELQLDFLEDLADIQAVADDLWAFYAFNRTGMEVLLADDGTAYHFWDDVSLYGVSYKVAGVTEPHESVDLDCLSTVTLRLWEAGEAPPLSGDSEDDDQVEDTDPPPECVIEAVTKDYDAYPQFRAIWDATEYRPFKKKREQVGTIVSGGETIPVWGFIRYRLWCVVFTWEGDLRRLVDFLATRWDPLKDRSKSKSGDNFPDLGLADDGKYYIPIYIKCGNTRMVDVQALYFDGQWSAETDGQPTGYPTEPTVTESEGDDETPTAPTLTSVSSYVDDLLNTPKKECSALVTVGLSANTPKHKVRVYGTNATTGKPFTSHPVKVAYADSTASVLMRRMFRFGDACHIDRIEVDNGGQSAVLDLTAPTGNFVAGSTAALAVAATATPKSGPPTLAVTFGSTPSGGTAPYFYDWDYGDGSAHGTTQNPSHNYTTEATFIAIVTVSDSAGQVAQATVPIQTYVGGIAGVPVPVLTADTTHGAPTLAVTFTRVATGGTAPYAWSVDYGDGTTPASGTGWNGASTALSAHNYTTAGTRTAILTVTDAAGVTAKIELAIFVGVPITPGSFAIAAGAMTSAVVKIPGSTAARCDALCAFTVANCLSAIATLSDGTKTHKATAECSGGSGTFYWGPHFKRGATLTITSVELINGQSRATVSTPANGTCTAGASAAPTPGVVTVGTVETKRRANLYPLTFTGDVTLTWCEVWKGASGATGDPDSNPTAWKAKEPIKLFTRDASGDPICNMTTAEARVGHAQDATIDVYFRLENVYGVKGAFVKSAGAAPGTSDDTVPVISSVTPVFTADDIPGTPGKEYDGYITVAWGAVTGAAALRVHVQVDIGSGKKRNKTVEVAGTDTSCEVVFNRKFKRGQAATVKAKVVNGTADSGWSNAASNPYTVGGSATNPDAPSSLTIEERKKHHTTVLVAIPADITLRKIELWKKLHAAADATTPADSGNTWTLVKREDIHQLALLNATATVPVSFQHQQDLDWDLAARFIDCYGGYTALTGANWATVRTGGSAGDGGNPMNGSPWTFAGSASWDTGNKWINVGGAGAGSARLDVPLHKNKISADLNIYLGSAAIDQTFGFLDDSGFSGYVFRLVSTTSGQLYKVDGSGTETAVGAAVTFPVVFLATQTAFRMEIHQNKVIVVLGAASTRFSWSDTSYRTVGWKFWCKTASTLGRYVLISAMTIDNNGKFYEGLAIASLQLITNASNHLDARGADVTDGTNFETLNNFFEYRDSAMHLRGAKLTGPKLTAVASLPALTGVEVGDVRVCKVTSGTRRIYIVGADDAGNKEWWKLIVDDATDTGTGGGATVPSGDIGMACFLLDSELPTPDGFALLGSLEVGQDILAIDTRTGEEVVTTVTDIKRHTVPYHILLGGFLGATEEHLLFRWGGGRPPCDCTRCTVGGLELGAMLWNRGGAPYALASKEVISGEVEVASIETGTRTYWIGKHGQYILAHNMKSLDI